MIIGSVTRFLTCAGLSALLIGCGGSELDKAAVAERAQSLTPADSALASVYDRSCKVCHAIAGNGAPLTGDAAGWEPRMDQGMDQLVEHVITGFGSMPPFGMCMDCDTEQFEALIRFMAAAE